MVLSVTSYQVHRLLPVTSNGVTCDKLSGVSVVTSVCYRSYHCYVSENRSRNSYNKQRIENQSSENKNVTS